MSGVSAGRVGRVHGLDGSFYVEGPVYDLAEGTIVRVGGEDRRVERRAGTDLVGCLIEGIGYVERVLNGPSCDVLEVGTDGVLVPLVSDAIDQVDLERRIIVVNREFLGL